MKKLESERLVHRRFTMDDLPQLIEMRSDPDVARYIGGTEIQTPEALAGRLPFYISCYEQNLGMHAVLWKETGEMIGWSGLQPLDETDETEVSYGFIKRFWRRGLGYETARFWLDHGFRTLGLERIVAVAAPENEASWRIMEKLGMRHEKNGEYYGMDCVYYAITGEEFAEMH